MRKLAPHFSAAVIYAIAALTVFPPISGDRLYFGQGPDSLLFLYTLEWERYAVFAEPDRLFQGLAYFPMGQTLFFTHLLMGALPVYIPAALLWGPGGGLTVVFIVTPVLNATLMYAALRYLTGRWWPGLVGGFAFAFAPLSLNFSQFLHLAAMWWIPLALLIWFWFLRSPRWWKVPAAAFFVMAQFATGVYAGFAAAVILLAVAATTLRKVAIPRHGMRFWALATAGTAVAAAPFLPLLWGYVSFGLDNADQRSLEDARQLAARLPLYIPWANYGQRWHIALANVPIGAGLRGLLPPGAVPGILAAAGLVAGIIRGERRGVALGSALGAGALFLLSLGPELQWGDLRTGVPLPFAALHAALPGFASLRNPTFFSAGMMAPLAVLGGIAIEGLQGARPLRGPLAWTPAAASTALLAAEFARLPMPNAPVPYEPQLRAALASLPWSPAVLIPVGNRARSPVPAMRMVLWSALSSRSPFVNGYSGYEPRGTRYLEALIDRSNLATRARVVEALVALGVKTFVLDGKELSQTQIAGWKEAITDLAAGIREANAERYLVTQIEQTDTDVRRTRTDVQVDLVVRSARPEARVVIPVTLNNLAEQAWRPPPGRNARTGRLEWLDESGTLRHASKVVLRLPPVILARSLAQSLEPLAGSAPRAPGNYELRLVVDGTRLATRRVEVAAAPTEGSTDAVGVELRLVDAGLCVRSGEEAVINVAAINAGGRSWDGRFRLGYSWNVDDNRFTIEDLEALGGRLYVPFEDERAPWRSIPAGSGYVFSDRLTTPQDPGTYILKLEMVEETVQRFGQLTAVLTVLPENATERECR